MAILPAPHAFARNEVQQMPELSSHMGWYSAPGLNFGVGQLRKRGSLG